MIKDGDFSDEQLLLTTVQAAKVLGVSRTTIYQLIKAGDIRLVHLGRCARISWAELERYVLRLDATPDQTAVPAPAVVPVQRRWRRVAHSGQQALFPIDAVPAAPGGDSAA
jgi:excisionase family DNA binding protein